MNDDPAHAQPSVDLEPLSDEVAIVCLRGEHDMSTAPQLSAALDSACEHSYVFVDLSECTFVDSTVIACLLSAHHKQAGRMAHLELVLPSHPASIVQRIAKVARLDALLRLHETRGDALASMRPEE
jgi:anti-anti-sigma factor